MPCMHVCCIACARARDHAKCVVLLLLLLLQLLLLLLLLLRTTTTTGFLGLGRFGV